MQVSKEDIIHGITNYVYNDILDVINNNNLKFIISAAVSAMEVNPKLADKIFENNLIKTTLNYSEDDETFDIDTAEKILLKSIKDIGELRLEIPSVPILMPNAQELIFHPKDIEKVFENIREEI